MCIDMCIDMCTDVCRDMCIDMCFGTCCCDLANSAAMLLSKSSICHPRTHISDHACAHSCMPPYIHTCTPRLDTLVHAACKQTMLVHAYIRFCGAFPWSQTRCRVLGLEQSRAIPPSRHTPIPPICLSPYAIAHMPTAHGPLAHWPISP